MEATFVYNRREEDVEQEGREHAPLTKALFHSKPFRAHNMPTVVQTAPLGVLRRQTVIRAGSSYDKFVYRK